MKTVFLDTNIILRFLLNDHKTQSKEAKNIFLTHKVYLDEVVLAEVVWVLDSYYQKEKHWIGQILLQLLQLPIVVNPKKPQLVTALQMFAENNLSYIDCWAYIISSHLKLPLKTQDKKLATHNAKRQ